jgi:hypothetical protein
MTLGYLLFTVYELTSDARTPFSSSNVRSNSLNILSAGRSDCVCDVVHTRSLPICYLLHRRIHTEEKCRDLGALIIIRASPACRCSMHTCRSCIYTSTVRCEYLFPLPRVPRFNRLWAPYRAIPLALTSIDSMAIFITHTLHSIFIGRHSLSSMCRCAFCLCAAKRPLLILALPMHFVLA